MPTNHVGKRIESPEVDCFQDRQFGCGSCISLVFVIQMYLLSYLWKKALNMCKCETIDLN